MKKIISAILAAVTAVAFALPSLAIRGKWDSLTWEIEGGVLTVTEGDIPDSTASSAPPWLKFAHEITSVVIGRGVKNIGDRAFEDMKNVTSVELGGAVSLGEMAFSGCTALAELALPETVISIGDFAFAECTALKKITLPSALVYVGEGVWESCPALAEIAGGSNGYYTSNGVLYSSSESAILRYPPAKTSASYKLPQGITAVSAGAFRDCVYLTSVTAPQATVIGDGAFYGCTALGDADISGAESIGRAAFYGCASLTEIAFGERLGFLGDEAFAYCSALITADFSGDAPGANEGIFYGCAPNFTVVIGEDSDGFGDASWLGYPVVRHGIYSGTVGSVSWSLDTATGVMTLSGKGITPDYEYASDAPWYEYRKLIRSLSVTGITGIGDNSFRYSAIRTLELPESVTHIGRWAFSGCSLLESAVISGRAVIGECAFFGCAALTQVQITSAAEIGKQAFSGCDSLAYVFTGMTAPILGQYAFDGTSGAVLYPHGGTGYDRGEWVNVYSEPYTAGDANGDGVCNIADVSLMLKYIAKWSVTLNRISADTNLDGKVNVVDVSSVLKYIAKWDIIIGVPMPK